MKDTIAPTTKCRLVFIWLVHCRGSLACLQVLTANKRNACERFERVPTRFRAKWVSSSTAKLCRKWYQSGEEANRANGVSWLTDKVSAQTQPVRGLINQFKKAYRLRCPFTIAAKAARGGEADLSARLADFCAYHPKRAYAQNERAFLVL